jgi:hypothetical protein
LNLKKNEKRLLESPRQLDGYVMLEMRRLISSKSIRKYIEPMAAERINPDPRERGIT